MTGRELLNFLRELSEDELNLPICGSTTIIGRTFYNSPRNIEEDLMAKSQNGYSYYKSIHPQKNCHRIVTMSIG